MILIHSLAQGEWGEISDSEGDPIPAPTYDELAQIAEAGKFDAVFVGDTLQFSPQSANSRQSRSPLLEPITVMARLTAITRHIGLIPTVSTTFSEPYNLARQLATIDYLSGGRAGWNVVTSGTGNDFRNFGLDVIPSHAARYRRASEFLAVTRALWRSWERQAIRLEPGAGGERDVAIDADRIHSTGHAGEYFDVEGPLNVPRPPQVYPVIVQAGASADGIAFAARHADVVFSMQPDAQTGREYRRAISVAASSSGRPDGPPLVAAGVRVFVASDHDTAQAKLRRWLDSSDIDANVARVGYLLNASLSDLPLDAPVPSERLRSPADVESHQTFYRFYYESATVRRATVRELAELQLFWTVAGTPEEVANALAERFLQEATDGYLFQWSDRESLELLAARVVPILQKRGLVQADYRSTNFRRNLGRSVDDPELATSGRSG